MIYVVVAVAAIIVVAAYLYFRNSKTARAAAEAVVKNAEAQGAAKVKQVTDDMR